MQDVSRFEVVKQSRFKL